MGWVMGSNKSGYAPPAARSFRFLCFWFYHQEIPLHLHCTLTFDRFIYLPFIYERRGPRSSENFRGNKAEKATLNNINDERWR